MTINSAVDNALVNNSRHESATAIIVADAVAGGKGRSKKRTIKTDKLLAQREERAILRDDLDKRQEALQSLGLCTSLRCKFKCKYCWIDNKKYYPLNAAYINAWTQAIKKGKSTHERPLPTTLID